MEENNPKCRDCGRPMSEHGVEQATGRQVKCPVLRAETNSFPQEPATSPRGDY